MDTILSATIVAMLPYLLELMGVIVAGLIGWAADSARRYWKVEIDKRGQELLHTAMMTGIRAALGRGLKGSAATDFAMAHVQTSVPKTLKRLKPATAVLQNLATAKLGEALK